ncbi:hypothetical protein POM88_011150 [Heracleum sosnowskyi]|uniref:Uncharacterized protein n=1 Tax=Heracleum sosnowskyi TaxID=360622 RepID=A0AAD8ITZ6_9APIA|nr:hypothetical protein POM88_011150 [Heracleum sosnowskyi]
MQKMGTYGHDCKMVVGVLVVCLVVMGSSVNEVKAADSGEVKPTQFRRTEPWPTHSTPTQSTSTESKPTNSKPTHSTPTHSTSTESKPTHSTPTKSKSKPTHSTPTKSKHTHSTPTKSKPTHSKPTHSQPTKSKPTHSKPTHSTPTKSRGPPAGPLVGPPARPLLGPPAGPLLGPPAGPLVGPPAGPLVGPSANPTCFQPCIQKCMEGGYRSSAACGEACGAQCGTLELIPGRKALTKAGIKGDDQAVVLVLRSVHHGLAGQGFCAWFDTKSVYGIGVEVGVEDWNLWVDCGKKITKREKIEKALRKLMDGEDEMVKEMRRKIKELGEAAKKAVQVGGSSHKNLMVLIEELKQIRDQKS